MNEYNNKILKKLQTIIDLARNDEEDIGGFFVCIPSQNREKGYICDMEDNDNLCVDSMINHVITKAPRESIALLIEILQKCYEDKYATVEKYDKETIQ